MHFYYLFNSSWLNRLNAVLRPLLLILMQFFQLKFRQSLVSNNQHRYYYLMFYKLDRCFHAPKQKQMECRIHIMVLFS